MGGSASARLPPEAVPWLRNGLTIDCTRLDGGGRVPAALDLEAVEDFVEELHGRRVLPGLRDRGDRQRDRAQRGARSRARARA